VQTLASHPVGRVIEESLLIFCWVANWRPIEIFLYEWWPIIRRQSVPAYFGSAGGLKAMQAQ
jgi:hypothetical protein